MALRAALALLLLLPVGQASEDWLSIKEWYATCTLTYTYSGKTLVSKGGESEGSEWTETETASLESVCDLRSAAPMVLRKADNMAAMLKAGRWQSWHPAPRPDRSSPYVVSGESHSSGTAETKGEGGYLIKDIETTQKSRIGTGALPLALTRIQIDREKKKYAIAVPILQVLSDHRIGSLQSSWHEHVQPTGYRETRSETLQGPTLVVNGKLGAHSDVELNSADVMVFDRALPDKVGPLAGSIDIPLVPGRERGGKVEKQVRKAVLSWSFSPTPPPPIDLEIDVVQTNAGPWADWRPKGTEAADKHGGHVDIRARVVSRGGALPDKPVKIALRLADVSSEPGICVNFPVSDTPSKRPDLRFISNGNAAVKVTDLAAWTIEPDPPEIQARLGSFDYGGWADVMAEARLESGRILIGRLKGKPAERKLLVPDRDPDSKIARVWKSPGKDDEDLDDKPEGDGQHGDGFSNYEEYRGFRVGKIWKDGDPAKKEFFVRNEAPVLARAGIDLFEAISQLRVHRVDADEIRSDRVVNFNKGYANNVDQHGVRVFFDPKLEGECWAESSDKRPGLPKDNVGGVHIGVFENRVVDTADGGVVTRRPYGDSAVAHELLHCCNVYHHGDPGEEGGRVWTRDPTGPLFEGRIPIKVFDEAGNDISDKLTSGNSLDVPLLIRRPGGLASGSVSCVMRYDGSVGYVLPGPQNHRVKIGPGDPPETFGGGLCTSADATGTNVKPPGRFGAATRGNCAGQIVVRDNATRTNRR